MQLTNGKAGIMPDGCWGCMVCGGEAQCVLGAAVKDGAAHESVVVIGDKEYQVQANPVLNGENKMTGIVISFVDLTESLRSKARLQEALRVERDTNQTKQHFLANFGHEIKTPLNAIVGFGDVLKLEKNNPAKVAEYVGLIRESAAHLQSLFDTISDLMMTDSDDSGRYCRPTDVRKKFSDLKISFRDFLSEQNNHLFFDIAPDVPMLLQLDAPCVRRILTYLLHNACKYTHDGTIMMSAGWNDGELRIVCQDTGVGIPADKLDRIFEPFFQVDAVRDKHQLRGEGLGLAAARQQATRMGGRIEVESREGVGSVFTLILQNVRVASVSDVPPAPLSADRPAEGKLVALVLDDIELNVKVLSSLCGKADIEVKGTTKVDEAFEILQKENISLVFADVWMPVMDGAAFARKVHTLPGMEKLPIYAVTADMAVQHNFDVSVFRGVLQKPMTLAKLNAVVENFRGRGLLEDSRLEYI
ncbi:MAG: ATP-binding protein [Victivallaceae bacterium]|nr:ATP-binding protein [Victivallaceae bacterium]